MYDKVKTDLVLSCVDHLFITKTRKELGFEQEPADSVHYIELSEAAKSVYNIMSSDKVYTFRSGDTLIADSVSKLRHGLHMLEGGVAKVDSNYLVLGNCEKVNYIKEMWGDTSDLVIMYNFKAEKTKLEAAFKEAIILQATSNSEGIDLHKHKTLVVYSQDYSTARHTQRRARQANLNRKEPIVVHFLLVKGGISEEVYNAVSVNKINYIDSLYKGNLL